MLRLAVRTLGIGRLSSAAAAFSRRGIAGRATAEGTSRFFERHYRLNDIALNDADLDQLEPRLQRVMPRTGWSISRLGFGTNLAPRRGGISIPLAVAFSNSINVIDTSPTFNEGTAELDVGEALSGLLDNTNKYPQDILARRSEVVVIDKVGPITKPRIEALSKSLKRELSSELFAQEAGSRWYSLAPEVLEAQITTSLEALNLETIDVLMLQAPEVLSVQQGMTPEQVEETIYQAFKHLEREVARGRIQYYGVAAEGLVLPEGSEPYISLPMLLRCAERASSSGAQHSFAAVQFPFNVLEPSALLLENHNGKSTIEYAEAAGIACFSNRPLHAQGHDRMTRLVTHEDHTDKDLKSLLKEAFDYSILLEANYPGEGKYDYPPSSTVAWGQILASNQATLDNLYLWKEVLNNQIGPILDKTLEFVMNEPSYKSWAIKYKVALETLFRRYAWAIEIHENNRNRPLNQQLEQLYPGFANTNLADKALRIARSSGVDCVLNGMGRNSAVLHSLSAVVRHDPIERDTLKQLLLAVQDQQDQQQ